MDEKYTSIGVRQDRVLYLFVVAAIVLLNDYIYIYGIGIIAC